MIIKNIKLENFRNILNEEIILDKHINVLSSGTENGSGKTSILDAINLLYYNQVKGKLEDYINWDADYFLISSEAKLDDGTGLFIEIKFSKKNKTERKLILSNEDQPYINSDATKKLEELLKPSIALVSSVFLQGSNDIVHIKPAERREFLKSIYNLKFADIIKNIEQDLKNLKDIEIKDIENKIYSLENKEYTYKEVEEIDKLDLKTKQVEQADLESKIKDKEIIFQAQEKEKLECLSVSEKIEKVNNRLKEEITQLDKYKLSYNDKESLQKSLKEYEKQLETLSDKKIKDLEKELFGLPLLKRVKTYDESIWKNINSDFSDIVLRIKYAKENLEKIKSGICPVCDSKFEPAGLAEKEKDIKKLEDEKLRIGGLLEIEKQKRKEHKKAIEKNTEVKHNKTLIESNISKEKEIYENKKKTLEENIEKEKNNIARREKELQNLIDKYEKDIKDIQIELSDLENKKEELNSNQLEIDANLENIITVLKSELDTIKDQIKEIEKKQTINEQNKKHNKETGEQEKTDKKSLENFYKDKDKFLDKQKKLERAKIIYTKEFPNYVISKLISGVENDMNRFLDKTYKGKYKVSIQEKRDSIYIYYGPKKSDIVCASGYEQQIISSAYKDALIKLGSVNYPFILDEADGFATEKNSIIFYDFLCKKYNDKQIILITQKEDTKNYVVNNFGARYFEIKEGKLVHEI